MDQSRHWDRFDSSFRCVFHLNIHTKITYSDIKGRQRISLCLHFGTITNESLIQVMKHKNFYLLDVTFFDDNIRMNPTKILSFPKRVVDTKLCYVHKSKKKEKEKDTRVSILIFYSDLCSLRILTFLTYKVKTSNFQPIITYYICKYMFLPYLYWHKIVT